MVIQTILFGSLLIVVTTVFHGFFTAVLLDGLRAIHVHSWARRSRTTRSAVLSGLVLALFLASVVEAAMWAVVYLRAGVIEGPMKAMYFSVVTFTTLGYGDITLPHAWGLLASFQAALGLFIFGWSTAIVIAAVQKIYFHQPHDD